MIYAGLTLMLAGMTTVFVFLMLMMFTIQILAFLSRHRTQNELQVMEQQKKKKTPRRSDARNREDGGAPLAVIAAAISAFEQDHATT